MKLTFYGATHEVTGSCFLLEADGKCIMIDCGMEQGACLYENKELDIPAANVDCVLLTHAHIDHSGNLPLLYTKGFRGDIFCTDATYKLCDIMLRDSAHIHEMEAEWKNRKAKRSKNNEVIPIYTMDDTIATLDLFKTYGYNETFKITDNISIRFVDVGHLLGSASIEVFVTENNITKKLVFSGDIGNLNQPLIKDPSYIKEADYIIMESTYGDRFHSEPSDYVTQLTNILQTTFDRGGNVVIPSFAVGRTQEILYFIRKIKEDNLVKNHGDFPVYVDSPLAIEATDIYNKHTFGYYDDEAIELLNKGINPIRFSNLRFSLSQEESQMINIDNEPKVIISASGMCDAGRIRHHLKHNLWRPECTILFVGYQANGTLGRIIWEGAKKVKLFGEEISVCANIMALQGTSAHADQTGLLKWINSFEKKPERIFIVHGQDEVCDSFSQLVSKEFGVLSCAPYSGEQYDLLKNIKLRDGNSIKLEKKVSHGSKSPAFIRLQAAGERLASVINHNEGGANKDLAKFADQIIALCEKWDR